MRDLECLRTLLGGLSLKLIVHLTYDGLQIAFEQTVTEGNHQQRKAGEDQYRPPVTSAGQIIREQRNRQADIAQRHDDQTPLDRLVVVLSAVGDDTAYETQHVDTKIEYGIDDTGNAVRQTEFTNQKQCQYGVHDVVTKALAHVSQGGRD